MNTVLTATGHYSLTTSPLTIRNHGMDTTTDQRISKTISSIFEKLENGTYRDSIITANDAFVTTPETTTKGSTSDKYSVNPILKSPMFWNKEVFTIERKDTVSPSCKHEYRLVGNDYVLAKLDKQLLQNKKKIEHNLRKATRKYNKYFLRAKKQELLEQTIDGDSFKEGVYAKNKLNGEYLYMKLLIREVQIVKYDLLLKLMEFYQNDLIEGYKRYTDPYNTTNEKKRRESELTELFNQFYDLMLQVEFLEREENKMLYLIQNKKAIKIEQHGYFRYYLDRYILQRA